MRPRVLTMDYINVPMALLQEVVPDDDLSQRQDAHRSPLSKKDVRLQGHPQGRTQKP